MKCGEPGLDIEDWLLSKGRFAATAARVTFAFVSGYRMELTTKAGRPRTVAGTQE